MGKILEKARLILRNVYIALGATAMPMLVHAGYGQRQPDLSSYTIPVEGRVFSEETGEPVAGISVRYGEWPYVNTDSDGRFLLYVHEEDSYTVWFSDIDGFKNGGYFSYKDITIPRDEIAEPLAVSLSRESQVAVIRGTVRSKETGEPLSGIRVSVVYPSDSGNESGYTPYGSYFEVSTDSDGQFSIQVPERDAYSVYFTDYNERLFQWKEMRVSPDEIKDALKVDLEQKPDVNTENTGE
ncbi:hypothetical protein FACS1894110_13530 [Spirochaetia bacterium]|nr:hypothetical protein FACS1894110_13530 [Spirochaetia bacterium]